MSTSQDQRPIRALDARRATVRFVVTLSALVATAWSCGGSGSSDPSTSANVTARVLWQQSGLSAGAVRTVASAATTDPCFLGPSAADSGFGTGVPPSVDSVRIEVKAPAKARCCVSFNAASFAAANGRQVVLPHMEVGKVTIGVTGFADNVAPDDGDPRPRCVVDESGNIAAEDCESFLTSPSFRSEDSTIDVAPGKLNDAGDIRMFAIPFFIKGEFQSELQRPVPGTGSLPDEIPQESDFQFTVAKPQVGLYDLDEATIRGTVIQDGLSDNPLSSTELLSCEDTGGDDLSPCTQIRRAPGTLEVRGAELSGVPQSPLRLGPAELRVEAQTSSGCQLDFTYPFTVVPDTTPDNSDVVVP